MTMGPDVVRKDCLPCGGTSFLSFRGRRLVSLIDLTSRDCSVLDARSQAGDDGDAFDFFKQQDQAEDEGPPILGRKGEDTGKSEEEEEEEEALDPLGIMR